MVDDAACAACGSVGLLLRAEAALCAALICEVALAIGVESESGIMMAAGEEVDAGGADEARVDCSAEPDIDVADGTRIDDWEESDVDITGVLRATGCVESDIEATGDSSDDGAELDADASNDMGDDG